MNEKLGSRIKELRIAKHLTQEQLAEHIGMSRQKYARIESGVANITLETLSHIASIMNISVGDITRVLDEEQVIEHRVGEGDASTEKIFEMLDLFYANKHLYEKLQHETDI